MTRDTIDRRSTGNPIGPRIALSLLSLFLVLVVFEIAFRVKAYTYDLKRDAAMEDLRDAARVPDGARVGLAQSIRISGNPRIVYEMIPELSVVFRDATLTTDARGFRRVPQPPAEGRSLVRMVGLGDSFMFGWNVSDEECYLSLLSERLNGKDSAQSWNIVNMAVPGYNTVMEVEAFKEKGLALDPDIVLMHTVINDRDLPNFILRRSSIFSLKKSFLRERFREGFMHRTRGVDQLIRLPGELEGSTPSLEHEVPAAYRDMAGLNAYEAAMRELHAMCERQGSKLLVLCDLNAPDFVRNTCGELEIPVIETYPAVIEHLRPGTIQGYRKSDLICSPDDTHPSATGHALLANVVYDSLNELGLIE